MHHIRHDIVQKPLIVSDHNRRLLRSMKCVHAVCYDAEGVHIESAVCLVKYSQCRIQHGHLENLVTLLLTARESHIHLTLGKLRLHLHERHLLTHQLQEVSRLERLETLACAMRIHRSLHEVRYRHSRNLHRILERQEYACPCTFLRRHGQKVLSEELYGSGSHGELRLSCKHC